MGNNATWCQMLGGASPPNIYHLPIPLPLPLALPLALPLSMPLPLPLPLPLSMPLPLSRCWDRGWENIWEIMYHSATVTKYVGRGLSALHLSSSVFSYLCLSCISISLACFTLVAPSPYSCVVDLSTTNTNTNIMDYGLSVHRTPSAS
jgi:hypothetical protein